MTTLRKYSKLITALCRADAGSNVKIELGERVWWRVCDEHDAKVRRDEQRGCFEPAHIEGSAEWDADLFETWSREHWLREQIPESGEFTADFYVYTPGSTYGYDKQDWELDTNVVVTFVDGVPTEAHCTGGRHLKVLDAAGGSFTQSAAPRRY